MAITFGLGLLLLLVLAIAAAILIGLAVAVPFFLRGVFLLSILGRWCLREFAPDALQARPSMDKVLSGIIWLSALGFVVVVGGISIIFWAITSWSHHFN